MKRFINWLTGQTLVYNLDQVAQLKRLANASLLPRPELHQEILKYREEIQRYPQEQEYLTFLINRYTLSVDNYKNDLEILAYNSDADNHLRTLEDCLDIAFHDWYPFFRITIRVRFLERVQRARDLLELQGFDWYDERYHE